MQLFALTLHLSSITSKFEADNFVYFAIIQFEGIKTIKQQLKSSIKGGI